MEVSTRLYVTAAASAPDGVSQTMVNGMNQTYPLLKTRQATATIRTLVNSLYENWEDINTNVRQIMEVDSKRLIITPGC